jgi:hypothetical protein
MNVFELLLFQKQQKFYLLDQSLKSDHSLSSSESSKMSIDDTSSYHGIVSPMVSLNHSNERRPAVYDNMERLQPQQNLVKVFASGTGTPLHGAWLHRGTGVTTTFGSNDVDEIILDSSFIVADIPPSYHYSTSFVHTSPPTRHNDATKRKFEPYYTFTRKHDAENANSYSIEMDDQKPRNCKLYLICSLILFVIITSMAIGFGIHSLKKRSSITSISEAECSVDSNVIACSASHHSLEIPDCIKERIGKFQQMFNISFQEKVNNLPTCIPQNMAIVSIASQLTDSMSNHSVHQRYGLSLLYFATQGYSWTSHDNWLSDDGLCDWNHIDCSIDPITHDEYVIGIKLANNNLHGSIPSLFLEYLPNLQVLDLSHNNLEGTIPSNVHALTKLILNNNNLTGLLPSSLIYSTSMETLSLHSNHALTLPRHDQFFSGPSWKQINLGNVSIKHIFPRTISSLPNLEVLDLTSTLLGGKVPSEIGLLSKLLKFTAVDNSLTGQLPTEIGLMKSLKVIDFSQNKLSGTIPSQIGSLINLEQFQINDNAMVGTLPSELSQNTKLTNLKVKSNMLSGTLPKEIGELKNLKYFLFAPNRFTGEIPFEICDLKSKMVLFGNDMNGCLGFDALKCPKDWLSCCCNNVWD